MLNTLNNKLLEKKDINNYYINNFKDVKEHKIGLEYERISYSANKEAPANLEDITSVIKEFSEIFNCEIIYDNTTIIGAKFENSTISLEPGGQFEISLEPTQNISELQKKLNKITNIIDNIAKKHNVRFLELGLTPKYTFQNINMLSKTRYLIMANYFKKRGSFAPVMMRETAGIQVNIDYKDEYDAIFKLNFLNKTMPFLTGLFANSNTRNGKKTNYKSFRALAWKYTDKDRVGAFYMKSGEIHSFNDYIEKILDVPMLFIERNNKKIIIEGKINFKEFMKNGYMGYFPTLDDYILHSSLTFPDIRLKKCIEIRNHDSGSKEVALAICALYKGLFCSNTDIQNLDKKLINMNYKNIENAGYLASKYGACFEIAGYQAKDILNVLCEIAYNNLQLEERSFLSIIKNKIDKI